MNPILYYQGAHSSETKMVLQFQEPEEHMSSMNWTPLCPDGCYRQGKDAPLASNAKNMLIIPEFCAEVC